jgi:AraC-like DNA-binding protein
MRQLTRTDVQFAAFAGSRSRHRVGGPHLHQEHEINVIVEGGGSYVDDRGGRLEFMEGETLFFPAGCDHRIEVPERSAFLILLVHPELVAEFRTGSGDEGIPEALCGFSPPAGGMMRRSGPGTLSFWSGIFEQARVEQERVRGFSPSMLRQLGLAAAGAIVRYVCDPPEVPGADPSVETVGRVRAWIDRNCTRAVSVEELAGRACMSPSHFAHVFRENVGLPPMAYVRERRLAQAAYLLGHTRLPVTEIALESGFSDISHFNHCFKRRYESAPRDFRRNHQE